MAPHIQEHSFVTELQNKKEIKLKNVEADLTNDVEWWTDYQRIRATETKRLIDRKNEFCSLEDNMLEIPKHELTERAWLQSGARFLPGESSLLAGTIFKVFAHAIMNVFDPNHAMNSLASEAEEGAV